MCLVRLDMFTICPFCLILIVALDKHVNTMRGELIWLLIGLTGVILPIMQTKLNCLIAEVTQRKVYSGAYDYRPKSFSYMMSFVLI